MADETQDSDQRSLVQSPTLGSVINTGIRSNTISLTDGGEASGSLFRRMLRTRSEWSARAPRGPIEDLLTRPAPYVVVGHTVCANYSSFEDCLQQVKNIQTYHFTIALADIGFNFLVGGDGYIYEGRGWAKKGAHTKYFNAESVGVWFIGTFEKEMPAGQQLEALRVLLEEGVRIGALAPDYKMFLHWQLRSSDSPGRVLSDELMKWPHWEPYVEELYPRCG